MRKTLVVTHHQAVVAQSEKTVIDGGAGNDSINARTGPGRIYSSSNYSTIFGGTDDKLVSISGGSFSGNTVSSEFGGNKTIYSDGKNNTFCYELYEGKSTIFGFSETDSLYLKSDNISSTLIIGNDLIIEIDYVGGYSGSIILKDVFGKSISVREDNNEVS